MKSADPTAERKIYAVANNGVGFEVHLSVGVPYQISKEEWACSVRLDGLHSNLRDQHGIDSWQALQLSYQLIAQLLGYFVQEGGQLYWEKDREPISLSELIPQMPAF